MSNPGRTRQGFYRRVPRLCRSRGRQCGRGTTVHTAPSWPSPLSSHAADLPAAPSLPRVVRLTEAHVPSMCHRRIFQHKGGLGRGPCGRAAGLPARRRLNGRTAAVAAAPATLGRDTLAATTTGSGDAQAQEPPCGLRCAEQEKAVERRRSDCDHGEGRYPEGDLLVRDLAGGVHHAPTEHGDKYGEKQHQRHGLALDDVPVLPYCCPRGEDGVLEGGELAHGLHSEYHPSDQVHRHPQIEALRIASA